MHLPLTYSAPCGSCICRAVGIFLALRLSFWQPPPEKGLSIPGYPPNIDRDSVPGSFADIGGDIPEPAVAPSVEMDTKYSPESLDIGGVPAGERTDKEKILKDYIKSIFPPVFDLNRPVFLSMYEEVIRYHPYITAFNWADASSPGEKMKRGAYLLTVQSMLLFLMVLFVDIEVRGGGLTVHISDRL